MKIEDRKYLVYILLTAIAVALAIYFFLRPVKPLKHLYDAVPVQSAMIIESDQPSVLWNALHNETGYWKSLLQVKDIKVFNNQLLILDTLLRAFPDLQNKNENHPAIFSMLEGAKGYGFVLIAEIGSAVQFYEIERVLWNTFEGRMRLVEQKLSAYQSGLLMDGSLENQFSFVITNGLLIGSFDKDLVERCLHQLNTQISLQQDSVFMALRRTKGTKADAHIFINYENLSKWLSSQSSESYEPTMFNFTNRFGNWVSLDLSLQSDIIQAVGYSTSNEGNFLKSLKGQQAVPVSIYPLLPYSTRFFLHMGLSDFQSFNLTVTDNEKIEMLSSQLGISMQNDFLKYVDSEAVLAFDDDPDDPLFVIKISDIQNMNATLEQIRTQIIGNDAQKLFGEFLFSNIKMDGLIPLLFGTVYQSVSKFNYVFVGDYLLVANNFARLENVIQMYKTGRTLEHNENFKAFRENLSDDANVTIYGNLREGLSFFTRFLSPKLMFHLSRNVQVMKDFEAFALQFQPQDDWVYSNFFVKYNPGYKEESMLVWNLKFENLIVGKPGIISGLTSENQYITITDNDNKLYFLSSAGEIIWKRNLDSEVLSNYYVIDNQRNKSYFIFNTQNFIYAFDRMGNSKSGFPIRLNAQATNGIAICNGTDFANGQIVVSCSDRITYSFDFTGQETEFWEKPKSTEIVQKPIKYLEAIDRSYMIITDIQNNHRITDLEGKISIQPKGLLKNAVNSDFFINKTNAKGVLLTTDQNGDILYVSVNGQMNLTEFADVGTEHYFIYQDFRQDDVMDYVFIEDKTLTIYDRFKKQLFSFSFNSSIDQKPFTIYGAEGKMILVLSSLEKDLIYLFDNEGNMTVGENLTHRNAFDIGWIGNSDEMHIISSQDSTVFNYLVY
jgi:outer membrane protein assembly factor BamB